GQRQRRGLEHRHLRRAVEHRIATRLYDTRIHHFAAPIRARHQRHRNLAGHARTGCTGLDPIARHPLLDHARVLIHHALNPLRLGRRLARRCLRGKTLLLGLFRQALLLRFRRQPLLFGLFRQALSLGFFRLTFLFRLFGKALPLGLLGLAFGFELRQALLFLLPLPLSRLLLLLEPGEPFGLGRLLLLQLFELFSLGLLLLLQPSLAFLLRLLGRDPLLLVRLEPAFFLDLPLPEFRQAL